MLLPTSSLHPSTPALAASLIDDPFYQAVTIDFAHDAAARRTVLQYYLDCAVREAQRGGLCHVPKDPRLGMAIWSLPRPADVEEADAQAKVACLQNVLGPQGMDSYHRIIAFMGPRASGAELQGAWYLSILGIDPAAQGQGLGARLLAPALASADEAGVACYLETFSPRNERFYARMGFSALASHLEPVTGAHYTIMLRTARR
ncbi:GNAT superfamily N-acetyltransferase [Acidovorax soli]|uniref:GNAT superfamily N-acetyltransferase n=1 Tax=Acidovorax soli TaxID=592050 RepID=A0A7X0PI20_9BURK|nr:GNAT family N-acetyltransferase [Acidovorax soli]MBB6562313.1 GNAT superfamily N-acetyltransferase [Acidovorax soli]